VYKQKLDALIKKLEKLSEKVDAVPATNSAKGDASTLGDVVTQPPTNEERLTTAPTQKSKVLKMRGCIFSVHQILFSIITPC
jgi:hypothetical protein